MDNNEFKEIRPDAQEMECRFEYTIDLEEPERDQENSREVVTEESVTVEAKPTFRARRKKEELSWQRNMLLYLHDLVYLLAAVILVFLLCFRVVVVSGTSMNHTLLDNITNFHNICRRSLSLPKLIIVVSKNPISPILSFNKVQSFMSHHNNIVLC